MEPVTAPTTTTTTSKPEWVKCLEEAALVLRHAREQETPLMTDAKTRVAYGWIDMARLYKEIPPTE